MAKNKSKKQSKRQPAKLRYKIEKNVRDHNKKLRRELKKKPKVMRKKMIQVPNICPFKEDILKEVEALKNQKEDEKQKQREAARVQRLLKKKEEAATGLQGLVANADGRGKVHDALKPVSETTDSEYTKKNENSLKAYYKEFKKVIEAADVVLEVVDARDPLGTRCLEVEQAVSLAPGNKRLVIVVNKADLVPRDILESWIKYLRKSVPAIAFKASTQNQTRRLGRKKMGSNQKDIIGSNCMGAELLMSLLANYCRNKDIKTSIRVGIVGLPNVGKSSIINSLKRSRACNVGATPGITKAMQEVQLDTKIKLLDSPGIVFASGNDASSALRNAVRTANVADPMTPANAILQRVDKKQLMEMYDLTEFHTPEEFYSLKAARTGKFRKGGIPDATAAARGLLEDWNSGKIKYYTVPPEENTETHVSAKIVNETAKEFDLDNFAMMETEMIKSIVSGDGHFVVSSLGPVECQETEETMDEKKSTKGELLAKNINTKAEPKMKKLKVRAIDVRAKKVDPEMMLEGNQKHNQIRKNQFKREKKAALRLERVKLQLSVGLENVNMKNDSENYDFNQDFAME